METVYINTGGQCKVEHRRTELRHPSFSAEWVGHLQLAELLPNCSAWNVLFYTRKSKENIRYKLGLQVKQSKFTFHIIYRVLSTRDGP